jgi:hypothetical protein
MKGNTVLKRVLKRKIPLGMSDDEYLLYCYLKSKVDLSKKIEKIKRKYGQQSRKTKKDERLD